MNIRLYNARILSMEENRDIFFGEVWVKKDRIVYAGDGTDTDSIYQKLQIPCMIWDREIDCEGNLLMPGFKDAHTHSGMTLLRSYADDLPLNDWLNQQVFPVEAKLTDEDIYELTKLAVLEYLTSGITAVFDMYLTPYSIYKAFDEMGMRGVQVGGVNNFSQSPELLEEYYLNLNGKSPLQSFMLGFHAEYTCSQELLMKISEIAHKYKAPVFTHLSETKAEVEGCRERYGMTPVAFLDSLGMFDYGGGGYHCVHVTEEDIAIMKKRGMYAVSNPGSNTKLASGIAPITQFLKAGVPVALGTDGPASNNCLDMFREMFLVTGLAKLKEEDAAAVDAMDVLKMATVNGAHAMGLGEADVIAEGKLADLIMIDLKTPNMQPLNNIAKNIVYSGSKINVKMTMIGGRILYENGSFLIDEKPEDIYEKANEIIAGIK
ncbi:MAG: amidohydrolase [Lachnospiraceae bacterium]|nr:amidohydrolase [Lachnospiraceae bacterium]MDD7628172.1 amidohydrolase [Lachnospiraceae bacterium]MDY4118161.1 amidohydrolase [Lachnospiraceae bacterium]